MNNMKWESRYADRKEPLYQTVYYQLYYAITSGQVNPGEHLAEHALSARLRVSRTPVRMALGRLEQEGLVLRSHGRTVVQDAMDRELREILETRIALESLAASSACRYAKPEDIDRLIRINREFADALRAENTAGSASADEKFHEEIYRIADNRVLLNMIRELEGALYGYRVRACETGEDAERQMKEHLRIIHGIKKKRPDLVREAVKSHILGQCRPGLRISS